MHREAQKGTAKGLDAADLPHVFFAHMVISSLLLRNGLVLLRGFPKINEIERGG